MLLWAISSFGWRLGAVGDRVYAASKVVENNANWGQ